MLTSVLKQDNSNILDIIILTRFFDFNTLLLLRCKYFYPVLSIFDSIVEISTATFSFDFCFPIEWCFEHLSGINSWFSGPIMNLSFTVNYLDNFLRNLKPSPNHKKCR